MRKIQVYLFLYTSILLVVLSACIPAVSQTFPPEHSETLENTHTLTHTNTLTSTEMATITPSPTISPTITVTLTPTITATPTISPSPTYDFPDVTVNVQAAHCRYGPSKAYLHAADLYEGDTGVVHGRFNYSNWLYIKWDKLDYHCWVSPYVVEVSGDISSILFMEIELWRIPSTLYGPPQNVQATREGDLVNITWDKVWMTEDDDRGYLIEAWVCQDGAYLWWTASFENQYTTNYTVKDEQGCSHPSSGRIYTVEKHGYTESVPIPWPEH